MSQDARVFITPATHDQTINIAGSATITGHVDIDDGMGAGWVPAPDGTVINFALQGVGGFTGGNNTASTASGTGEGTVHVTSNIPGAATIAALTVVRVNGVDLTRATSGLGHTTNDGTDANLLFVNPTFRAYAI